MNRALKEYLPTHVADLGIGWWQYEWWDSKGTHSPEQARVGQRAAALPCTPRDSALAVGAPSNAVNTRAVVQRYQGVSSTLAVAANHWRSRSCSSGAPFAARGHFAPVSAPANQSVSESNVCQTSDKRAGVS